jgi:hypothetical protein
MDGENKEFVDIFNISSDTFDSDVKKVEEVEVEVENVEEVKEVEVEVETIDEKNVEEKEPEVEKAIEEEVEEEVGEDEAYYQELMQNYLDEGVFDIDGDEIEADFSENGLKDMISKTVSKRKKEAIEEYKNSLGEKGAALLEVIEKGGAVEDFLNMDQEVDYSTVPVTNNQQVLIEDWLSISGYTDDEINDTINDYLEAGDKMLTKQAELAKKKLVFWQKEKNESLLAEKETAKIEQQKQAEQNAIEFRDRVVQKSEISGFKLSKQKATALYDFITKPDKDGRTGFQKADTEENQLLYAYFAMEGFNKDKLTKEIASKQTRLIKKKLSQFADENTAPKRSAGQVRRANQKTPEIHWNI